ncbi:putative glycosyl transferase, family I [Desulfosarcina variabilis str. Montpellier]
MGLNVVRALVAVGGQHKYLFILPEKVGYEQLTFPKHANCAYLRPNSPFRQACYDLSCLPRLIDDYRPDIIWGLGNTGVYRKVCLQAVLIHNPHRFYPIRHAGPIGFKKRIERVLRGLQLKMLMRSIDLVFCQTESMRKRMIKNYAYTGRTSLMPNAISIKTLSHHDLVRPDEMTSHEGKFRLLTLTKYYPHKNLERIVETFSRHRQQLRDVVVFMPISADQGRGAAKLIQRIADERLTSNVICTGAIPQEDLASWFQHCDGMLFPTLLESFSGTYVESMHFGLPIITSDLDFAHDVCGDAAYYCNPWQVKGIRDAILTLKNSKSLRQELVQKGRRRLQGIDRPWDDIVASALADIEALAVASL